LNQMIPMLELGEFIEQAFTAANTKARELGWIVWGRELRTVQLVVTELLRASHANGCNR
jgi:hypothetical protein